MTSESLKFSNPLRGIKNPFKEALNSRQTARKDLARLYFFYYVQLVYYMYSIFSAKKLLLPIKIWEDSQSIKSIVTHCITYYYHTLFIRKQGSVQCVR